MKVSKITIEMKIFVAKSFSDCSSFNSDLQKRKIIQNKKTPKSVKSLHVIITSIHNALAAFVHKLCRAIHVSVQLKIFARKSPLYNELEDFQSQ